MRTYSTTIVKSEIGRDRLNNTVCTPRADVCVRACAISHRWNRSPRPQPDEFSTLLFLMT